MDLRRFYFAHRELFVIPVEHLGEGGMSDTMAQAVREDRGLGDAWIELCNRAYATYWARATALHAHAPESWFPPRLQNLCIVVEPAGVRPYFQPFHKSSWVLYASDFDPAVSNLEHAVYQLLHAERLGTSRDMAMAVICGMSYWLVREDAEIEAFCTACHRSPRPDAVAFVRLAEAMPWIRTLWHDPLRRPPPELLPTLRRVREAGLWIPAQVQPQLQALVPALRGDAAAVLERYLATAAAAPATDPAVAMAESPVGFVCEWLRQARPPLLVTDERDAVLWDPEAPDELRSLAEALAGIGGRVAQSLRDDLAVVGERSQSFLGSLRHPERLPRPGDDVDQDGGVYVHARRPLMVYSLAQPGLDPRREAAPPYHRLLVGARTIHEWGHLAEEAGWVGLPPARRAEHEAAQREIVAAVDGLLAQAPAPFVRAAAEETRAANRQPGALVCELVLTRMSDFLSNLLARHYLPLEELEAYVRANVHTHIGEETRPLHLLARHAYEYQYLSLGRIDDPLRYFLRSTWFSDYFVDTGLVPLPYLLRLLQAVARVCGCYEVDASAFVEPPIASA
jgi:hypothetical protein